MIIQINDENPYKHMWLFSRNYSLNNELFSKELQKDVLKRTKLSLDLDDWWRHYNEARPEYSWKELIKLSLEILNCEATRLLCHTMWLEQIPSIDIKDLEPIDLPSHHIPVSNRITCACFYKNTHSGDVEMHPKFRLFGKTEDDRVGGTWFDWITLATFVLSDDNTKHAAPELYCRELRIEKF